METRINHIPIIQDEYEDDSDTIYLKKILESEEEIVEQENDDNVDEEEERDVEKEEREGVALDISKTLKKESDPDSSYTHYIGILGGEGNKLTPIINSTSEIVKVTAGRIRSLDGSQVPIDQSLIDIPILTLNPTESILILLKINTGYGRIHSQSTAGGVMYDILDDGTYLTFESYAKFTPSELFILSINKLITKLEYINKFIMRQKNSEYMNFDKNEPLQLSLTIYGETHTLVNILKYNIAHYIVSETDYDIADFIICSCKPRQDEDFITFNMENIGDKEDISLIELITTAIRTLIDTLREDLKQNHE